MKKLLALFLVLIMSLSLFCGCAADKEDEDDDDTDKNSASERYKEDEEDEEEEDEDKNDEKEDNISPEVLDEKTILGVWKGEYDLAASTKELPEGEFIMECGFQFNKDGTYIFETSTESMKTAFLAIIENEESREAMDISEEEWNELLNEQGLTAEEYIDKIFDTLKSYGYHQSKGEYEFDGEKLSFDGEEADFSYKKGVFSVEYASKKITMEKAFETSDSGEELEEEELYGTWQGEVDTSHILGVEKECGVPIKIYFIFEEDSFTVKTTEEDLREAIKEIYSDNSALKIVAGVSLSELKEDLEATGKTVDDIADIYAENGTKTDFVRNHFSASFDGKDLLVYLESEDEYGFTVKNVVGIPYTYKEGVLHIRLGDMEADLKKIK